MNRTTFDHLNRLYRLTNKSAFAVTTGTTTSTPVSIITKSTPTTLRVYTTGGDGSLGYEINMNLQKFYGNLDIRYLNC
jgi:hypothetical protein